MWIAVADGHGRNIRLAGVRNVAGFGFMPLRRNGQLRHKNKKTPNPGGYLASCLESQGQRLIPTREIGLVPQTSGLLQKTS